MIEEKYRLPFQMAKRGTRHFNQAVNYENAGLSNEANIEFQRAEDSFKSVLMYKDTFIGIKYRLALCKIALKKFQEALELLESIQAFEPRAKKKLEELSQIPGISA